MHATTEKKLHIYHDKTEQNIHIRNKIILEFILESGAFENPVKNKQCFISFRAITTMLAVSGHYQQHVVQCHLESNGYASPFITYLVSGCETVQICTSL